jgi:hypothetical protein
MDTSLIQIIIALIIVILMGYISYNIYTIEFEKLLKGSNTLKKETSVFSGIVDFYSNTDLKSNTFDIEDDNYLDIAPSINQQGGAEYSYNFWLYIDRSKLSGTKDHVLLLKGNKEFLINTNKTLNCSSIYNQTIMIKNPLVRLSPLGDGIAVEYNNIVTIDSYQDVNKIKSCDSADKNIWKNRNGNLLGVYDLDLDKKWFMITIVMKEVSAPDNILFNNKASSKMYVNGILISDKNVETKYNDKIYSATFKNNNAPLYVNPAFDSNGIYSVKPAGAETIKMADLKYYNYAITDDEVNKIYNNGFTKSTYNPPLNTKKMVLSNKNSGNSLIKDL